MEWSKSDAGDRAIDWTEIGEPEWRRDPEPDDRNGMNIAKTLLATTNGTIGRTWTADGLATRIFIPDTEEKR